MAETTKIEWYDYNFRPWREKNGNRIVAAESMWKQPLKWDREAKAAGERRRVFCASLADVFEDWQGPMLDANGERLCIYKPNGGMITTPSYMEEQPANCRWMNMQDVRNRLFRLIDATQNLDWLLLTKRPENIAKMMPSYFPGGYIAEAGRMNQEGTRQNLWLGVSVENQQAADERIPHLLRVPAAVRFLSVEPLLGPVDLEQVHITVSPGYVGDPFRPYHRPGTAQQIASLPLWQNIHWVIVGGESGPGARPCNVEWIRSIVQKCKAAGVECFVKQLGARPLVTYRELCVLKPNPPAVDCAPTTLGVLPLHDKKGGDPDEWPIDLRIREFPI